VPAGSLGFHAQGQAVGHAVKPAGQRLPPADGPRLAGQQQEGGLVHVLGVVLVVQQAPRDAEHHRPVPPQEGVEGRLFAPAHEPRQQFAVAGAGQRLGLGQLVEVPDHPVDGCVCHGADPWGMLPHY
jgi:hypothetical protein